MHSERSDFGRASGPEDGLAAESGPGYRARRREVRRAALADMARRLNSAGTAGEAAHTIVDCAMALWPCRTCRLDLYDRSADRVRLLLAAVSEAHGWHETAAPGPLLPCWREAARAGGRFVRGPEEGVAEGTGLIVPIRHRDDVIGLLSLVTPQADADDLQLLQELADHCGGAIERVHALAALRESEQTYRDIFDLAPVGIYRASPEGEILAANAALARILRYPSPAALVGRMLARDVYFDPLQRDELIRQYEPQGGPVDLELIWKRADDTPVWVQLNARGVRGERGQIVRFEGFVRDITAHKKAQAALRLLAHTVESSRDMITVTGLDDRVEYANEAFLRGYGYTSAEIVGQPIGLIDSPANPGGLREAIYRESRREGWTGELLNRRKDGSEFPIELSTSMIRDESGRVLGLVGIARDLGERKRLEEQARRTREIEPLARVAESLARELEAVLGGLSGFAEQTLEGLAADDPRRESLTSVVQASEQVRLLTQQLLALGRGPAPE